MVHTGHDLHQALGADGALGKGVKTGFDRHDGQYQGRVELGLFTDLKGVGHQRAQRFRRDGVFFTQPEGHRRLFAGQILGVGGRGAVNSTWFGEADAGFLARQEQRHQADFAGFAQVGAGCQGDHHKHQGQAEHGKTVVADLEETGCNVVKNIPGAAAEVCHALVQA